MKILDLLAKLGILRFGTKKAVWHSGRDLPEELLMNDVFNAKRDLTTVEDIKAAKQAVFNDKSAKNFCTNCGEAVSAEQSYCTSCGHKN